MLITNDVKESSWVEFLNGCDGATIYHTPQWKKFLELTFDYKPYYQFLKDESDQIIGLLPLFYVKSRITGNRLSCLPFAHECGFIGDKDNINYLFNEPLHLYETLDLDYVEVRSKVEHGFLSSSGYSTYLLRLSFDVDNVWRELDKGSVRWAVKKAEKMGVSVETSIDENDLFEFYKLNCLTKKKLGVPGHPFIFINNLFKIFRDFAKLYIAKCNGKIIGAGIMLYFRDTVLYGYGAADPDFLNMHPYNALIWKAIADASLKGYRVFDFGRVSHENTGLADFKRRWGTSEKALYYSSYPGSLTNFRKGLIYNAANEITKRMPLIIYKNFSNNMFSHFG